MNKNVFTQSRIQSLLLVMCLTVFSLFGISISFGVTYPAEIITPDNWDTKVPSGNYGRGGLLSLSVSINASEESARDSSVTFNLENVTSWTGYCMNAGTKSDFDLQFVPPAEQISNGISWSGGNQSITASWKGKAPDNLTVTLKCYDYGAYGELVATLYHMTPSHKFKIPKDENGNRIADGWKNDETIRYNPSDDNESGPAGNSYPGDGFSVFEEYRGFVVKGLFKTTTPPTRIYSSTATLMKELDMSIRYRVLLLPMRLIAQRWGAEIELISMTQIFPVMNSRKRHCGLKRTPQPD